MNTPQLQIDFNSPVDFSAPLVHHENNPESQAQFNDNIDHFTNQCKIVYKAFMRGERLTTTKALVEYGIGDLRRRVKDLIDNYGVSVQKETVQGKYKEYFINTNQN